MTEFTRDAVYGEERLLAVVPPLVGDTEIARPAMAVYEAALAGQAPQDDAAVLVLQFSPVDAFSVHDERITTRWRFQRCVTDRDSRQNGCKVKPTRTSA